MLYSKVDLCQMIINNVTIVTAPCGGKNSLLFSKKTKKKQQKSPPI